MFSLLVIIDETKPEKDLKIFLKKLLKLIKSSKNNKDLEIVFVFNEKNITLVNLMDNFLELNENIFIKFIYSSKYLTFNKIIQNFSTLVNNDYFLVLFDVDDFDANFFDKATRELKKEKVDILEFQINLKGKNLKWKPKKRNSNEDLNKVLNISKNPKIITTSLPFIFNKFISLELLRKTLPIIDKKNKDVSNELFSEIIYLIFLNAEKYKFTTELFLNINIDERAQFIDYDDIIKMWNMIKSYFINYEKYLQEIDYAKLFYLKIILCSFYSFEIFKNLLNKKRSFLQKKYSEKLNVIIKNDFNNFYLKNDYMLNSDLKEVKILKENHRISKWNKLFKELES